MENDFIDVFDTPFSRYGAYVALSADRNRKEITIHNIRRVFDAARAFTLVLEKGGERITDFTISASPARAVINTAAGHVEAYVRDDETIVFESFGPDFVFNHAPNGYGIAEGADGKGAFRIIGGRSYSLFTVERGQGVLSGPLSKPRDNAKPLDRRNILSVKQEDGKILMALTIAEKEVKGTLTPIDTKADIAAIRREWEAFYKKTPCRDGDGFVALSWFNLWSCYVRAEGHYGHDAMLMSKKYMSSVWAWDHCFNALAIAQTGRQAAYEQFELPFLRQAETGALPDMINPNEALAWGITKPPVHGWCFGKLMDRFDFPAATLKKTALYLEKQLRWWTDYRDSDGDGIPDYPQGCDSGWDNSTSFDASFFMETPDLPAYLVLQALTIGRIYEKTGDKGKAKFWRDHAEKLLKSLYEHSWNGERFVAKASRTHEHESSPTSLITLMPIVLGDVLDRDKMDRLVAILRENFLTEFGIATEEPKSPRYISDGYWRGPIWAPPTYLIIDGLRRAGHDGLAREIAVRFINMVSRTAKGNYENFDALTGRGLRAPGYTWTTSVFLLLLEEYGNA
ncbi:MAG: hypothetical protein LBH06_00395 [Rikenellaceae bacterium]|nr:hypothetical protein [Rikenellaceae bacterium]